MFNFLGTALKVVPLAIDAGVRIYDLVTGRKKKKEEENRREEEKRRINEALNNQLRVLNHEKNEFERTRNENERRIAELQRQLQDNIEQANRERFEREKQLLEKEQKEKEERMRQIEKEKEEIEKCKVALDNEYTEGIIEITKKFKEQEENWIIALEGPEIDGKIVKLKEKLGELFDRLFEYENCMEKIHKKFMNIIKTTFKPKELEKMNFIVIGTSGVGKSTLINEIFGEQLAKEGMGKRTTIESKRYESKLVPFISLLDTMGTEIGTGHKLVDVLKETLDEIINKLDKNDPNEHVHCIIYCTSSNRFFEDELDVILKLREKYDGKKLPIVIVYTRATKDEEAENAKKTINEFLTKHGESLSDDIFGITFIKVNAREEKFDNLGDVFYKASFGLPHLMSTCIKKGEKSYRYAIKSSLIQIGKNSIKEYMENMYEKLTNNNYFNYLAEKYEPNFSDYISFCFYKMTDIDEQKGISKKELQILKKYLIRHNLFIDNSLSVVKCMLCNKIPKNPLKCDFCKSEICKSCYLNQVKNNGYYECKLCEQAKFLDNENNEYFNKMKDDNINDTNEIYEEKNKIENEEDNYNNINIKNVLTKKKCMICLKDPENPLKCEYCQFRICNVCFLKKLEDEGECPCENCGKEGFEKLKTDEISNKDDDDDENMIYKYDQKEEDNKNEEKNDNYNEIKEYKNLSKKYCMICSEIPNNPLKCENCEFRICNDCFLKQLENVGEYSCKNCGKADFINDDNNENEINLNEIKDDNNLDNKNKIEEINEKNKYNLVDNKKNLSKKYCMICSNIPKDPYKCKKCGFRVCYDCFLKSLQSDENCICKKCDNEDFEADKNLENNNLDEKEKINEDEEEIDMDDFDENDNDNYIQILNNNLSPASKAEINNYVKEFKNELAEVISEKFNEFAKKSADEIYTKVLEKYVDLRKIEIKMGNMKTKADLKEEAEKEINNALREKAIENFLSKMASQFFKEIVFKFKERCELKLKEFIDNLLNNEQANEFFASCDEINGKKKLKFEEDINKYIKLLQQKEEESQKKAIQAKFGSSKMESESCGCSPSEQNCGDSQPNCESSQPNTSSNFNYEKNF